MRIFLLLLLISAFATLAFSASDCEHTCCRTFSGSWDDDFDDCKHPKEGFDTCLSDCEAAVWAARPQGPDTTDGEHYSCKVGFILAAMGVGIFLKAAA
ncbi:MAG: hypothetical protein V1827_03220 [Candidatus Micrarchaeota archaeon]